MCVGVRLSLDGYVLSCSCRLPEVILRPCLHVSAVFAALERMTRHDKRAEKYNMLDGNWISPHYLMTTWKEQLEVSVKIPPNFDIASLEKDPLVRLHRTLPRKPGRPRNEDRYSNGSKKKKTRRRILVHCVGRRVTQRIVALIQTLT